MIDITDKKILNLLQENSKISNADIARSLGMAPSSVFERIKQMESKGIISGYSVNLNYTELNCSQTAFIFIKTNDHIGEVCTANEIAEIPEIQEVHHIAGEDCYLIKVRVADNKALAELMRKKLGKIKSITSSRTTIVLETIKETTKIKIDL